MHFRDLNTWVLFVEPSYCITCLLCCLKIKITWAWLIAKLIGLALMTTERLTCTRGLPVLGSFRTPVTTCDGPKKVLKWWSARPKECCNRRRNIQARRPKKLPNLRLLRGIVMLQWQEQHPSKHSMRAAEIDNGQRLRAHITANKKLHWVHYFNQTEQVLSEDLQNMVRAQIYWYKSRR